MRKDYKVDVYVRLSVVYVSIIITSRFILFHKNILHKFIFPDRQQVCHLCAIVRKIIDKDVVHNMGAVRAKQIDTCRFRTVCFDIAEVNIVPDKIVYIVLDKGAVIISMINTRWIDALKSA